MLDLYLSADGLRALIVLVLAIVQSLIGMKIDQSNVAAKNANSGEDLDTPLIPFGPFFAIWLVIFAGCIGFAIWQILPQNLSDPYLRDVAPVAGAMFFGASLWQYWAPTYGLGWKSVIIITLTAKASLICVYMTMSSIAPDAGYAFWLSVAPLLLMSGWLSVAIFANLSATLVKVRAPLDPRTEWGASALILLAGLVVALVGHYSGSFIYLAAALWGFVGILVKAVTGVKYPAIIVATIAVMILASMGVTFS